MGSKNVKTCEKLGMEVCEECIENRRCIVDNWSIYMSRYPALSDRELAEHIVQTHSFREVRYGNYSSFIMKAIKLIRPNIIKILSTIELLQ